MADASVNARIAEDLATVFMPGIRGTAKTAMDPAFVVMSDGGRFARYKGVKYIWL
jgi:hypothetical protein